MHTHQTPPGCSLLGRTRPRRRPSGGFRPHAGTHTCTHDTGDPRAYYMSKKARARARCTFTAVSHAPTLVAAAPAASRPAVARSTAASRRPADSHRPLAVAAAPLYPPREAPWLPPLPPLPPSTRLCAYHGRCRRQGTCETRTGDSDIRPGRLPHGRLPHGRTPAESTERGGARGGLAACRHRRMVALARGRLTSCPGTRHWPEFCAPGGRAASRRRARTATRLRAPGRNRCR